MSSPISALELSQSNGLCILALEENVSYVFYGVLEILEATLQSTLCGPRTAYIRKPTYKAALISYRNLTQHSEQVMRPSQCIKAAEGHRASA